MVARIWRGRTRVERAEEYAKYVEKTGVRRQRATPGNLGSFVLRRDEGSESEFLVVSLWESLVAVRGFAGQRFDAAVYYPDDQRFLLEMESQVRHYEVSVWEMAGQCTDGTSALSRIGLIRLP